MHIFKHFLIKKDKRKFFFLWLFLIFPSVTLFSQETDSVLFIQETNFNAFEQETEQEIGRETNVESYYKAIHYKGSAKIDFNNQQHQCQFYFVNVLDSFLYVQANVVGIEVFRVFATPDKILFINKMDRCYYEGDYFKLQIFTGFDLNFFLLQNIYNGVPEFTPFGISLSYSGELTEGEHIFFRTLQCKSDKFGLKLEIKKVTFDDVPNVAASIPKNFTPIKF